MHARILISVGLAAALSSCRSCGGARSEWVDKGNRNIVLEYGSRSRWGWSSFKIDRTGRMESSGAAMGKAQATKRGSMRSSELDALAEILHERRCCELRSDRAEGEPEEGKTELILRFPGMHCRVELWDNEWRNQENAKRCVEPIRELQTRLR